MTYKSQQNKPSYELQEWPPSPASAAPCMTISQNQEPARTVIGVLGEADSSTWADLLMPHLSEFSNECLAYIARTSRLFRDITSQELSQRKLNELLRRVVCGEEVAVKAMLERYPALLIDKTGEVTDYSGRRIKNLTPFQAALCAGDSDMCQMIKTIFLKYPETGGFDEMHRQFNEIFPESEGWLEGHIKRQKENIFNFDVIVEAITNALAAEVTLALSKAQAQFVETEGSREKSDDQLTLVEAFNRFRESFSSKSHREIVFNPEHLLTALEIYKQKSYNWQMDQLKLFWCQIIGFVERFLPACDAQAFAQGLYGIIEDREPLKRSLNFQYDESCFYPNNFNSTSNLGFDYAAVGLGCWAELGWGDGTKDYFTYFISRKDRQLHELMQNNPQPRARCAIQ